MNNFEGLLSDIANSLLKWLSSMETAPLQYKMCEHAYDRTCLDATSLAYDLRYMLNVGFTEQEKDEAKVILDSYQTGKDGFFYEKDYLERLAPIGIERVEEMHGNYITFQAAGAYKAINRMPSKEITFYDQFIESKGIKAYLTENCPWDRSPWGAGGMVDNLGTILDCNIRMGFNEYRGVMDQVFEWLNENQSSENGLWGNVDAQGVNGLVNGGYHLMRGTYFLYDRPFEFAYKIIDTILEDLNSHPKFSGNDAHGCQDLDHFYLLERCVRLVPDYRKDEIAQVCYERIQQLVKLVYCDDGGFSFEAVNAVKTHNYFELSPGNEEGDMQGSVFFLQTFLSVAKILSCSNSLNFSKTHSND